MGSIVIFATCCPSLWGDTTCPARYEAVWISSEVDPHETLKNAWTLGAGTLTW